jgi:hypothetical protein
MGIFPQVPSSCLDQPKTASSFGPYGNFFTYGPFALILVKKRMLHHLMEVNKTMKKKWAICVLTVCVFFLSAIILKCESRGFRCGTPNIPLHESLGSNSRGDKAKCSDEVFWRENYMIWMKAVREFAAMGGIVGTGEDAGYIYMLYGFSLIRELELHQEAGFHPIDVIMNATGDNARILADLILVDGNPLKNLKYLYPSGVLELKQEKLVRKGGTQWTIKDGFVYHAPTLLENVKNLVSQAKGSVTK